jgi:hypothetical protein
MLVSFPMDDATEKGANFSHGTSGRAQHEGLFDSGEDSWDSSGEKGVLWRLLSGREDSRDNSGENAAISKCHCSEIKGSQVRKFCRNGLYSPLGIETLYQEM